MAKRSDITDEQVIEACAAYHLEGSPNGFRRLLASTGLPPKVVLAAMDRAPIDFGVSLETGWPAEWNDDGKWAERREIQRRNGVR